MCTRVSLCLDMVTPNKKPMVFHSTPLGIQGKDVLGWVCGR